METELVVGSRVGTALLGMTKVAGSAILNFYEVFGGSYDSAKQFLWRVGLDGWRLPPDAKLFPIWVVTLGCRRRYSYRSTSFQGLLEATSHSGRKTIFIIHQDTVFASLSLSS